MMLGMRYFAPRLRIQIQWDRIAFMLCAYLMAITADAAQSSQVLVSAASLALSTEKYEPQKQRQLFRIQPNLYCNCVVARCCKLNSLYLQACWMSLRLALLHMLQHSQIVCSISLGLNKGNLKTNKP